MDLNNKEIDLNESISNSNPSYTFNGLLNTLINSSCENKATDGKNLK